MKSTNANRAHFLLFLSSLLLLTVSALTDEKSSTLTGHTNPNDAEAIQMLMENYPSLGYLSTDDQDDPCLPEPYPWVNCSSDENPRITALIYWGTYRRILAKSGKNKKTASAKSGKKKKTAKVKSGKKKKTTLAIALGTLIPIFLILLAIGTFLYRIHRKRKAAAAAVQKNGTSEPAIPMYGNTTSPNPLLPK
ncbi:hypothetical protein MKW98_003759 [Papaver atlanticum]|uniref:Uncharacterized protein n=1 Tax=Papaver atlanticum TaxID=357466 RepID=A0AAD4T5Q9_9MAGN|nr:hypothetical protein MKW98_003759 [Papaver atlanticum]